VKGKLPKSLELKDFDNKGRIAGDIDDDVVGMHEFIIQVTDQEGNTVRKKLSIGVQ
jgi:hypothetical protein